MIVVIEDKETGEAKEYKDIVNFWFDTNIFNFRNKLGSIFTVYRRYSRLKRIYEADK